MAWWKWAIVKMASGNGVLLGGIKPSFKKFHRRRYVFAVLWRWIPIVWRWSNRKLKSKSIVDTACPDIEANDTYMCQLYWLWFVQIKRLPPTCILHQSWGKKYAQKYWICHDFDGLTLMRRACLLASCDYCRGRIILRFLPHFSLVTWSLRGWFLFRMSHQKS